MAKRTTYHVTHDKSKGEWKIQKAGAGRASARARTKSEAIDRARELGRKAAPNGQVKVHKKDGTIQTEWTYGGDPKRYPS